MRSSLGFHQGHLGPRHLPGRSIALSGGYARSIDTSRIDVRLLDPGDVRPAWPDLAELALHSKASWGYEPDLLAAFRARLLAPTSLPEGDVLMALRAGRRVGFAVVRTMGEAAWLDDLWVHPDAMGSGVGSALWAAAVARARAAGCTSIELEADPNAEAFYVRMGARRVGERPSPIVEGRSLPWMRADITDSPTA